MEQAAKIGHLLEHFEQVLAVAGLLVVLFFDPQWKIEGKWIVVEAIVSCFLIATLTTVIIKLSQLSMPLTPKVVTAKVGPVPGHEEALILLLEPSDWLAIESLVSIYRCPHAFERYVASGFVLLLSNKIERFRSC